MVILYKKKGWLRNVMMVALSFFLISDVLMLINLASGEAYTYILCPVSHAFYILAIPLLGYIYIREASQEREQAVDALRESEQHFRDIVNNTQAGYFFIDRQGHIQQVNKAWLQMHGYSSAAEVVGRHYSITQPDEIAQETQADIERLLNGELIPPGESVRLTKNGTIKYHTSSSNPVIQGGQVTGIEGFLIDRSQQVQAEAEVRRRNEQMAELHAITATISESRDLERMLGSVLESVVAVTGMGVGWIYLFDGQGQGALQLVAEHGNKIKGEMGSRAVEAGDSPLYEVAHSGQPLEITISSDSPWPEQLALCGGHDHLFVGVPIFSGEHIQGVLAVLGCNRPRGEQEVELLTAVAQQIGVAVENTQLAEEASRVKLLQELDRMRSELIANVSHDLRTPLGLIKLSGTSLLATDIDFSEEVRRELLGVILDEVDRLEKIVDDLLLLAQVESGRLQLHKRRTPATALIGQAISSMDAVTEQHQIIYEVDPPSLVINLDPDRMGQVLRNLLGNAIKYSPQGGTITVEAYADGSQAFMTVTDQGIGIPAQDLQRVFERFQRLDNPVTRQVRGAGLGLSVCRNLVQAHEGHIWVESVPGQGSSFFVAIPLDTTQAQEAEQSLAHKEAAAA